MENKVFGYECNEGQSVRVRTQPILLIRGTTSHRTPDAVNLDLAHRISSSLHRDFPRASLRRRRLAATRDALPSPSDDCLSDWDNREVSWTTR